MTENKNFQQSLIYLPPLNREQDRKLLEDIARQFVCKLSLFRNANGNLIEVDISAPDQQSLNSFIAAFQDVFGPYCIDISIDNDMYITVNHCYNFIQMLRDYILSINPLTTYVNENGGWIYSTSSDKISGLKVLEKALLDGTLPEDVAESVKLLENLIASYQYLSEQFQIKSILPSKESEIDFIYPSDDTMETIQDDFPPYYIYISIDNDMYITVNHCYNFIQMLRDYILSINPLTTYVNENGGWIYSTSSDKISGLEVLEKELLDGTLPEDVAESVKLLTNLIASSKYLSGQFQIKSLLPSEESEIDFDYQSDDTDDDSDDDYYFDDNSLN